VISEVLMVISMKMAVFWDIAEELTASIIKVMMESVSSSETLVNIYQATWQNIPEDILLQNLNSSKISLIWYKNVCQKIGTNIYTHSSITTTVKTPRCFYCTAASTASVICGFI
jgi:hypothetical protein